MDETILFDNNTQMCSFCYILQASLPTLNAPHPFRVHSKSTNLNHNKVDQLDSHTYIR